MDSKYFTCIVLSIAAMSTLSASSATSQDAGHPPIGTIVAYAGVRPPNDGTYLLCDGSSVPRARYRALAAALGEAWGRGAVPGEFRLPDLRGQFLRGVAWTSIQDPGLGERVPNGRGEISSAGSTQGEQLHEHKHDVRMSFGKPLGNDNFDYVGGPSFRQPPADKTLPTGSAGGTETRPKNAYVYYLIRAN